MSTATLPPITPLTKKDFQTDQEVRWCPGCGDYAILLRGASRSSRNSASSAKISWSLAASAAPAASRIT